MPFETCPTRAQLGHDQQAGGWQLRAVVAPLRSNEQGDTVGYENVCRAILRNL